ncbi:hypothetical protein [Paenibacillus eucommiae]|uniref:WD40 repeat domain-containing protein n=1 Tax=Paenibacillus eucommiae TaxID=1355755 RepID=A0ABS4IP80_9BACL|nr:hypothetical protein [Paenibacillus eucommiae]MBP1989370.1 hypothetical protein [Paenibacillus eucommiae]
MIRWTRCTGRTFGMTSLLTSRLMLAIIVLSLLMSGCTKELKSKTVIIPDTEASSEPEKVNEDFTVSKIYTLSDTGVMNRDILGWIDKNQLLGVYGEELERSFERVDYTFNSRQIAAKLTGNVEGVQLSPDGKYTAFFKNEDAGKKLMLFDLATNKEVVIEGNEEGLSFNDPIQWSSNSQFVSFGIGGKRGTEGSLYMYDRVHKTTKKYLIPDWRIREAGFGVKISDDGESALWIKTVEGQDTLVCGKLVGSEFISESEHPLNIDDGTFDYIFNDQILFVNSAGSLQLFDRRNATVTTLLEQRIGIFQLSMDRKYIAYSKNQEEIFVAKLQGNTIINEKSIYKGLIPFQIQWSPDNKKILLSGRKLFSRAAPAPAAQESIDSNPLPFIIEFK